MLARSKQHSGLRLPVSWSWERIHCFPYREKNCEDVSGLFSEFKQNDVSGLLSEFKQN